VPQATGVYASLVNILMISHISLRFLILGACSEPGPATLTRLKLINGKKWNKEENQGLGRIQSYSSHSHIYMIRFFPIL
jgi:hypothetical protein